ncbi:MAG: hypothetical protein AAGB18_00025 [Pseudomonadota bacterium]
MSLSFEQIFFLQENRFARFDRKTRSRGTEPPQDDEVVPEVTLAKTRDVLDPRRASLWLRRGARLGAELARLGVVLRWIRGRLNARPPRGMD